MKVRKNNSYSTDSVMKELWYCLVNDFRASLGSGLAVEAEQALRSSISDFRACKFPARSLVPSTLLFKMEYQLETFFKRYRFEKDLYTQRELDNLTDEKFVASQIRLASTPIHRTVVLHEVLQRARKHVKRILGDYDEEEHMALCKFGVRASVGCPAKEAYVDLKLLKNKLTGTAEHITWFETKYLPTDPLLAEIISHHREDGANWSVCNHLQQINVAKSALTMRGISPNTLIGTHYTDGLGKVLTDRLKGEGLNLRYLQQKHRKLAQINSVTREKVTADLKEASTSFCSDLINMLVPRKWYNVLKFGRAKYLMMDREGDSGCKGVPRVLLDQSFMAMGIGFTFPLQTLLFYSLLLAIRDLTNCSGRISVFGDDLIYPRAMHKYVAAIFPKLRLILNVDKTFVDDHFRESCGGDFYRGADVRPFQLQGENTRMGRVSFQSFLYKIYNGLLARWEDFQIPITLHYLKRKMSNVLDVIHQVPPHYPVTSGIRVTTPNSDWFYPWSPVKQVFGEGTTYTRNFMYIAERPNHRYQIRQIGYYWDALRGSEQALKRPVLDLYSQSRETLQWEKLYPPKKNYRSKVTGMKLRKLVPFVSAKGTQPLICTSGSESVWTEAYSG